MKRSIPPDTSAFIPLRPSAFAVLAALARGPQLGIEVLDHIHATVPGTKLFGGGTLYRLLRDMRDEGLIERQGPEHADRRHVRHGLTTLGAAVLRDEAARLERTLLLLAPATPRKTR
jgi:DNA-binding PadR family transcriptional regulator